ncbi:hypothetical protein ACH3PA_13185 [Leeuwenhoekiella sp. A2]|uniref:hypothetical protein n=1 Tax=Leeuwenhoekiella sp. A2 TaxID=3141460 RepID=UPI003A80FBD6
MKKITFLLILNFGLLHLGLAQKLITVDNSLESNAQYKNLQQALDDASANDTIYVHPSVTNYGDIYLTKPVTLLGYSHSDPAIRTMVEKVFLQDGASNVNINGFRVSISLGTPANNTSAISDLTIQNCRIVSLLYFDGAGVNNLLLQGNVIEIFGSKTANYNNFSDAIIMNNVFTGPVYVTNHQSTILKNNMHIGGSGLTNMDSANGELDVQNSMFITKTDAWYGLNYNNTKVVFTNCLSYNSSSSLPVLNGENNKNNINPEFINGSTAWDPKLDYHLKSISPAKGTGINGEDMGIFNEGDFTFNNYGYANGIPTVNITSLTPVVASDGQLEVNITTTSY